MLTLKIKISSSNKTFNWVLNLIESIKSLIESKKYLIILIKYLMDLIKFSTQLNVLLELLIFFCSVVQILSPEACTIVKTPTLGRETSFI